MKHLNIYTNIFDPSTPLERLTAYDSNEKWGFLSIEEAAGLSLDDFYKLMADPKRAECFSSTQAIWP